MLKRPFWILIFVLFIFSVFSCANLNSLMVTSALQERNRIIAEKVLPVTVEIATLEIKKQIIPQSRGWPWDFLYPEEDTDSLPAPKEREFKTQGLGSGVIVKKEAGFYFVITNFHVVEEAEEIFVRLHTGDEYSAELIGRDSRKDIALLKFQSDNMDIPAAVLGDSDTLRIGDIVYALGSPFGYTSSFTSGIVSAMHRAGPTEVSDFIQTDASINQGNSGGPLVNLKGEVIGINTWITTPTGGSIGLGFAIPINGVKRVLDDLIVHGEPRYGWLGISVTDFSIEIAEELKSGKNRGAFVSQIFLGSPAEFYGLMPGDIITSMNGRKIDSADQLIAAIGNKYPEDAVEMSVIRSGSIINLKITLDLRASDEKIQTKSVWPGLSVYPLTNEIKEEMEIPKEIQGIIVYDSIRDSYPYTAGIRVNDIIVSINNTQIINMMDFYSAINDKNNRQFSIIIIRNSRPMEVIFTLKDQEG